MSYVVTVYQLRFEAGGLGYDDIVLGPFRNEQTAERKAASIERAVKNAGRTDLDVSVQEVVTGKLSARDAVDLAPTALGEIQRPEDAS